MKRLLITIAIALLIFTFTAPPALAQNCHHNRCPEQISLATVSSKQVNNVYAVGQDHSPQVSVLAMQPFNPALPQTISGYVTNLYKVPWQGQGLGQHFLLKMKEGSLNVHLAPEWFLNQKAFELQPGDALLIKGERFTENGGPAMIAFEAQKGNRTLTLRADNGTPVWPCPW